MRHPAFSVILTAFLACFIAKIAAADEIPPEIPAATLLGKYGFSAVNPAVLSACYRIETSDLPQLNDAYKCWSDDTGGVDHAFCTHLHQRLALVVYTTEQSCWTGRQAFGSKS